MATSLPPTSGMPIPKDLFFERQRPQIERLLLDWCVDLPQTLVETVADYVIGEENPFGAEEWRKYFEMDVGPEPEIPENLYKFWYGPDPIDPTKRVCETHLPPVLRPRFVTHIPSQTSYYYSLRILRQLFENPQEGRLAQCLYRPRVFLQNKAKAESSCWLVMRKDVFARGQLYSQQKRFIRNLNTKTGADYEKEPSAIDLATVVLTRHVSTGERHLGGERGMENRLTFSRCKETVRTTRGGIHQLMVGSFRLPTAEYNSDHVWITTSSYVNYEHDGIAVLRKFGATIETCTTESSNFFSTAAQKLYGLVQYIFSMVAFSLSFLKFQ